ncbi:MAG: type II toxin-antitoxin system Phd/YefM family antitoxin [Pyrinomonadaceae bacterium]
MKLTRDIQSLSVFKRDTSKFMRQMKKTGEPIILTVNGKAEMIVQDAAGYEQRLEEWDRLDRIASVKRGIEDMKAGRTKPAEEVYREFERKHGIRS